MKARESIEDMANQMEQLKQQIIAGELDFRCLKCKYNMRGLPGDPKRCPECGTDHYIRSLDFSDGKIEQYVQRLESLTTYFLVSGFFIFTMIALTIFYWNAKCRNDLLTTDIIFLGIVGTIFLRTGNHFQSACRIAENGEQRARKVLAYGITIMLMGFSIILLCCFLVHHLNLWKPDQEISCSTMIIGAIYTTVLILFILALFKPYKKYRTLLNDLQWNYAIQLVQQNMEKDILRSLKER